MTDKTKDNGLRLSLVIAEDRLAELSDYYNEIMDGENHLAAHHSAAIDYARECLVRAFDALAKAEVNAPRVREDQAYFNAQDRDYARKQ